MSESISKLGEFMIFFGQALKSMRNFFTRFDLFLVQCEFVGVSSLTVVLISGAFIGAVMSFQLMITFELFGAQALLGGAIGVTLFREMGPVIAAIMVTGRAGAGIAAELATMRVSEQIDALDVMAIEPMEYLVMPRIAAAIVMVPVLSAFFAGVGTLSAEFVACVIKDLDHPIFWAQYAKWLEPLDLFHLLAKSTVFGTILSSVACFYGFRAQGGAGAVGHATRSTVVVSLLWILLFDYILTTMLPAHRVLSMVPSLF
jgi:phospholipid/cholesterol/gamma-HCH transport system permease protein